MAKKKPSKKSAKSRYKGSALEKYNNKRKGKKGAGKKGKPAKGKGKKGAKSRYHGSALEAYNLARSGKTSSHQLVKAVKKGAKSKHLAGAARVTAQAPKHCRERLSEDMHDFGKTSAGKSQAFKNFRACVGNGGKATAKGRYVGSALERYNWARKSQAYAPKRQPEFNAMEIW